MSLFRSLAARAAAALVVSFLSVSGVAAQCVSLTAIGSPAGQDFNTLSNTAGSTTNNLTITGWFLTETGGGARDNEQYAVDTGGSNTGDTFSYGAAGSTDRALGGLQSGTLIPVIGACYTNNTGATITSLAVAYTGEQWRIANTAAARDDRLDYQYSTNATSLATGTWTDVDALDFINPIKTAGTAGALDGNAAANRTAVSSTIPSLSIANGATFWIRWNDLNASGADDGLSVDEFALTPQGAVVPSTNLSINDVSLAEGNAGTTTFTFTVSLSAPAGAGGVTFDIATADGTAQDDNPVTEDNDYVAQSLTGQTIPAGSSTFAFNVLVNGDTTAEANETFFVNVTNVTGATVTDGQGQGTIANDDVALTPIHDIQGPGASSPIVGATVTTRGIVTGRKNNGFFIQEPDAGVDADPTTSEGILVFTGAAPPAAAQLGAVVEVTGTVTEFVPAADPLQPPLTELTSPTVVQISTGNPLPAAIALSATFPDPAGPVDQLERLEGMRVSVASATAVSGTGGTVSEVNATATNNSIFSAVVTGVARPFREPGIQANDPPPSGGGTIPPIPRWDFNPELFQVDFDALGGPAQALNADAVVTGLVGPLDFGFRRYTILPDPNAAAPVVTGGQAPTAVAPATAREFTVATYNLERFFDDVNDPAIGEPVLTTAAFTARLAKASLGIRDFLRTPDIIGVVEVENLSTLQALATRINNDAVAASQPNPQYAAFLQEGNDVGGIDVGFLVKTAVVTGSTPRVTVNAVVQERAGELFVNPDSSTELLNDRPPLRLDAIVNNAAGATFPVTVVVNHLRSLNGSADESAGSNGWPTAGARVRAKRQEQAESLADLVQLRQSANPSERIILVGDFNAFEFNDGLGDSIDVIRGTPVPDNQTAVPGDGIDLVNPDLTLLLDSPAERYSFLFGGNAQSLDHVLVNSALVAATTARRVEHPRLNADFAASLRGSAGVARLADHDPVVSYYTVAGFATADLSITKTDTPDPVTAGANLTYTISVTNNGPDPAVTASWSDVLPGGTTFVSLPNVPGWSCTTGATVTCSNPSFAAGATAVFTLTVAVAPSVAAGTVLSNTANTTSTTADPSSANNSATATTTVATSADVAITKTDTPDPVAAGANLTYTITATNAGPSNAAGVTVTDTLPAGTTFVSLPAVAGWTCTTGATVSCSNPSFAAGGSAVFTLTVATSASLAGGATLTNTATIATATTDPNTANNSATATTAVTSTADLAVTLVDAPDPVAPGGALTYTINVTNTGPSNAANATLADTLPANTTFTSLSAPAGWTCTTPPAGGTGSVNCTNPSFAAGSASFTLVVGVNAATAAGTVLSNTATVSTTSTDGTPGNNSATATTSVSSPSALSATKTANGPRTPGSTLTYTIVVRNTGAAAQNDNPGNELVDVLPAGLTLLSATASSGTALATPATNTVTWNGAIAAGASVTITITARITAGPGTTIANQATVNFDADGNGTNESTTTTDDPGTGAVGDPTGIVVLNFVAVPALTPAGLLVMLAMFGLLGLAQQRRRAR